MPPALRAVVVLAAALLVAASIALALVGSGTSAHGVTRPPATAAEAGTTTPAASSTSAPAPTTTIAVAVVPDVVAAARGTGVSSAEAQVASLGLVPRTTVVKSARSCPRGHGGRHTDTGPIVVAQTPAPGTVVDRGSVVELYVCPGGTRD